MRKRLLAAAIMTAAALGIVADVARAEDTKLAVIVFPGIPNLPIFAAQAKGFFAKRGLDVDLRFTPNSEELRNGLAEGRYQIAHSAIDNAFAMKDKANVDIAVVSGGDNSFNHLIVRPEITSLADIKGQTVVVDAIDTAYAFQLYEILRQKGLNKGDYRINPVGGTPMRLEAMLKDKGMVAGMMNPPFSINAQKAGLKSMGTAAAALGAYQGTSAFVLSAWASERRHARQVPGRLYRGRALGAGQAQQARGGRPHGRAAEAVRRCRWGALRRRRRPQRWLRQGCGAQHGGRQERAQTARTIRGWCAGRAGDVHRPLLLSEGKSGAMTTMGLNSETL